MITNKNLLPAALSIFIFIFLAGCASAPKEEWDPFKLVWPLPPEKPRIKYKDTLRSEEDVKPKKSIAESIFGAESQFALMKPYGVVVDDEGRVYVSDVGKIVVFDKKAQKIYFIGDRGAVKLLRPLGLFYDKKDKLLYVADSALDRVFVFDLRGNPLREMGQHGELKDPGGVAVDSVRNRVYVTNTKNHVISVFNTEGHFIENLGERGVDPGYFNFPTQIAIDSEGNLYVVDTGNFRVQVLTPEGKPIRQLGGIGVRIGQFSRPKGIAISPQGYVFVTDAMFHGVTVFDKDGTLLLGWGSRGLEKGLFDLPAGIYIDDNNLIYVVSQWTAKVDIFELITYPEDNIKKEPVPEKPQ